MFGQLKQGITEKLHKVSKLLLILITFLMISSATRSFLRVDKATRRVEEARQKVLELENENKILQERLEEAKSEEFIEKQLRDKLGLAKEGEIVVILPDDEIVRKFAPVDEVEADTLPDPNWKKWLTTFGFEF